MNIFGFIGIFLLLSGLGSGVIGVEDLKGGGDQDFDDLILSFNFQLTA